MTDAVGAVERVLADLRRLPADDERARAIGRLAGAIRQLQLDSSRFMGEEVRRVKAEREISLAGLGALFGVTKTRVKQILGASPPTD